MSEQVAVSPGQLSLVEDEVTHAYGTVVVDPPWPYKNPGEFVRGASPVARGSGSHARYGSMSLDALRLLRVRELAAESSHLYLWTTNAFVDRAYELARAWGFRPITLLTWLKTTEDGEASARTGYYFRGATEHCLFGVRGKAFVGTDAVIPTGFTWPRTAHSVKPDAFYDLVERMSPGPRVELFARRNRLGWETAGDEALAHLLL